METLVMKHSQLDLVEAGFRIGKDTTNLYEGEFDNLFVRGRMTVYELLINQIRASNGAVYVSDAAKSGKCHSSKCYHF